LLPELHLHLITWIKLNLSRHFSIILACGLLLAWLGMFLLRFAEGKVMNRYDITTDSGCHPVIEELDISGDWVKYSEHLKEIASLQAKIDELMLEYCSDAMTDDQLEAWADAQVIMEEDDG